MKIRDTDQANASNDFLSIYTVTGARFVTGGNKIDIVACTQSEALSFVRDHFLPASQAREQLFARKLETEQ